VAVKDVDGQIGVGVTKLLDELLRVRLVDAIPELTATTVDSLDVIGRAGGVRLEELRGRTAGTWWRGL
jgi:hypothetical protein